MAVAVPSREEGAVVPLPVTAAEAAALRADDVLARLGSGAPGLPEDEAARRLRVTGPNAVRSHRVHALSVLASQLRSPLLILLAVTALASAFLGQVSDAVIIGVILLASVGLGFVNEYKAAKTAEALAIPTDEVDPEQVARPARWDVSFIRRFMLFFGPISSVFDFLTFGVMLWGFHAGPALFRSGWFVESRVRRRAARFTARTLRPTADPARRPSPPPQPAEGSALNASAV